MYIIHVENLKNLKIITTYTYSLKIKNKPKNKSQTLLKQTPRDLRPSYIYI